MKVLIYDIECLKEMFLISIYNPEEDKMYDFLLTKKVNDILKLIRFLEKHSDFYFVGFNNLRYDSQIIEYIIRTHEEWWNKTNEEIISLIYQRSQDTIDDSNYSLYPIYPEHLLSNKQIDLFLIWHFNNENRRTSLKAVEYAIDYENIEESPVPFDKEGLTDDDIENEIGYCHNDVMATYSLYKITRGDTEMKLYKGEDKIGDRLVMEEEFGLKCLNFDNVKIGSEWNKMDYIHLTHKNENSLKPEKINHFYGKKFKQFFPKTVSFQTPGLKRFVHEFGETFVLAKKQEFQYKFNDELIATVAKGGLHSCESGRFIQPAEDEIYFQVDIGSQYPNAIRKYKIEPKHLPGWNSLIVSKIARRLEFKALYKKTKDPKYNSVQKMGKDALNGGAYGRFNTKGDWQEDPCCMLRVTIGCQLEILMIVEALLLKGFRVVSINTDGWDVVIKKEREKEFRELLNEYEIKIGNDTLGQFEYTEFKWIAQTSVNDYLALKADGEIKSKGDFEVDKEIHKNKSMRIVPIALREYFVNNVPVEETIKNHKNIYDFCIRVKSSKNFHYEGISGSNKTIYNKLIRYYISNSGEKLYKIKNPDCTTNAVASSQVNAGDWLATVCNYLPKTTRVEDCNINYNFYIEEAEKIIHKVMGSKIPKKIIPGQLNLF